VVKHNGPVLPSAQPLPATLAEFSRRWDLDLFRQPGLEAQIAALADDIAYNNHDIDDGVRAGLFDLDDLADLPLVGPLIQAGRARWPGLERGRLVHETIRRLIDAMVGDLVAETRRRLESAAPADADAVRAAPGPLAGFSDTMRRHDQALRAFLKQRMYRHYRVNRMTSKSRRVVRALFDLFMAEPQCLPPDWQPPGRDPAIQARLVVDYIAGMTDRFALAEHERLFDMTART
jgi:dGTPase